MGRGNTELERTRATKKNKTSETIYETDRKESAKREI